MLVGGGSDIAETAKRLKMPVELVQDAEEFRHDGNGVFPDNAQTVMVFSDMLTQWRVGPKGRIGLDYSALPVVMRIRQVKLAKRESVFDGVRVMERAALKALRG